jgi:hypothetical protein
MGEASALMRHGYGGVDDESPEECLRTLAQFDALSLDRDVDGESEDSGNDDDDDESDED